MAWRKFCDLCEREEHAETQRAVYVENPIPHRGEIEVSFSFRAGAGGNEMFVCGECFGPLMPMIAAKVKDTK